MHVNDKLDCSYIAETPLHCKSYINHHVGFLSCYLRNARYKINSLEI